MLRGAFVLALLRCGIGFECATEEAVEEAEEQEARLRLSLLQSALSVQKFRVLSPEEDAFALDQVRKAWYTSEIKERLDLGDVKQELLSQLSALQKECPDAEEIQTQMTDFWEEVGKYVRSLDLRLAIEGEQHAISAEREDVPMEELLAKDEEELPMSDTKWQRAEYTNATKIFSKEQEGRLNEIVSVSQRMEELQRIVAEAAHSDDAHAFEDQYNLLRKTYKDLTKDFSDEQVQRAFKAVHIKQTLNAVEKNLSNEHIEGELKHRISVPEYRLKALERQYDRAAKEADLKTIKQRILGVWYASLRDLPEMKDLRSSNHSAL
ncbi:unnamed protein product [Effrenium voratum]|nr:unnamed protein product [Effrenium voratum]